MIEILIKACMVRTLLDEFYLSDETESEVVEILRPYEEKIVEWHQKEKEYFSNEEMEKSIIEVVKKLLEGNL